MTSTLFSLTFLFWLFCCATFVGFAIHACRQWRDSRRFDAHTDAALDLANRCYCRRVRRDAEPMVHTPTRCIPAREVVA